MISGDEFYISRETYIKVVPSWHRGILGRAITIIKYILGPHSANKNQGLKIPQKIRSGYQCVWSQHGGARTSLS